MRHGRGRSNAELGRVQRRAGCAVQVGGAGGARGHAAHARADAQPHAAAWYACAMHSGAPAAAPGRGGRAVVCQDSQRSWLVNSNLCCSFCRTTWSVTAFAHGCLCLLSAACWACGLPPAQPGPVSVAAVAGVATVTATLRRGPAAAEGADSEAGAPGAPSALGVEVWGCKALQHLLWYHSDRPAV